MVHHVQLCSGLAPRGLVSLIQAAALAAGLAACGPDGDPAAGSIDTADGNAPDSAGPDGDATSGTGAAPVVPDVTVGPSPLDFAPDAPGPYAVGFKVLEWTYTVEPTAAKRTLPINVWYPAEPGSEGDAPIHHNLFEDPEAVLDAPAAEPTDGVAYPVHAYSHGNRAFGGSSMFLPAHFASHGWVTVAPDHVGDLLMLVGFDPISETVQHFLDRPQDLSAAIDLLESLPTEDPLSRADTSRVLVSGHSRGAYTMWGISGGTYDRARIAEERGDATEAELDRFDQGLGDPRVAATVHLAGAYRDSWFGDDGWQGATPPMLAIGGSLDNPQSMQGMFDRMPGKDLVYVDIDGGCHQTPALGGCTEIGDDRGWELVERFTLAFGRVHVLGDSDPDVLGVLDGSIDVGDEVTLQVR